MNRKLAMLLCSSVFLLLFSTNSYSMGGGAPSDNPENQAPPSDDKRVEEIDKARAEMKQDRAELDKIEKYMWTLDNRIIEARNAGDTKRLLDLKEQEQDTLERARLLKGDITRQMEQYPELKVSEALEAAKENPQQAQAPQTEQQVSEQPINEQQPAVQAALPPSPVPAVNALPVPKRVIKPVAKKTAQSSYIVYHEVEVGDTLFGISRKYFGTPSLYKEIAKQNNITDVSGLKQGMVLKIDLRWKNMVTPKPVVAPSF